MILSDADFLFKQWRKTITDFKNDYDKWEKYTLGDYIAKCGEIVRNQIENNMIMSDTCFVQLLLQLFHCFFPLLFLSVMYGILQDIPYIVNSLI